MIKNLTTTFFNIFQLYIWFKTTNQVVWNMLEHVVSCKLEPPAIDAAERHAQGASGLLSDEIWVLGQWRFKQNKIPKLSLFKHFSSFFHVFYLSFLPNLQVQILSSI